MDSESGTCYSFSGPMDETDFLFLATAEFEERFVPYARGRAPLGDDSGMQLNRALREVGALETAFAAGGGG